MDEAIFKSKYDHADLDDTRFGYWNVAIGEILNFEITGNGGTDITSTKVTGLLRQLSEEALLRALAASKISGVTNPWDFVSSRITRITNEVITANWRTIKKIQKELAHNKIELVRKVLPSSTSDW